MLGVLLASRGAQRRRRSVVAIGLLVLAMAAGLAWHWRSPRPNIILVTLDTTRADRLGAYGYHRGLTEGFDRIAAAGAVFEHAYAPAPITLPSHATMLTGRYPPAHGLRVNGEGRLPGDIPSLPEILQQHEYDTGAFIAAVVLDAMYGLERGFDLYDDEIAASARFHGDRRRDGQDVMDLALEWLRQRTSRPFFCWIHLYDAHAPYDPRSEVYEQRFGEHPYDAGVAWQCEQLGRLTAFLNDSGLEDQTVIVVAGDHGEGLNDHLEVEHGMLVYDTTARVPLAFAGAIPCRPGTRVTREVSLVDLQPTLLDLLGIPIPDNVDGRSLLPALRGEDIEPRDCYVEAETPYVLNRWAPLRAVVSHRWKYIHSTVPELYDLERDPGELTNLWDSATDERERLQAQLTTLQESFVPATATSANTSAADLAHLQALGYVSGGIPANAGTDNPDQQDLPDVKSFLPQMAKFEEAKHLGLEGDVDRCIDLLRDVAESTDDFPAANMLLGDFLTQAGRVNEARQTYQELLQRRPDFVRLHFSLGRILAGQGQADEALPHFRQYVQANPKVAGGHFELAKVLTQLQAFDEAISEYHAALQLEPDLVAAHISLGLLFTMIQQPLEAVACFQNALHYDPQSADAHVNLMIILSQMGRFDEAIQHGHQAVRFNPDSFETRFNLGILLISQQQLSAGIAQMQAAQKLRPDDPRPARQIEIAEAAMNGRRD